MAADPVPDVITRGVSGAPRSIRRQLLEIHRSGALQIGRELSAMPRTVPRMTIKRSDFGSLGDRVRRTPRMLDDQRVRHVWLDSTIPALVVDRRKTLRRGEGLVARVEDGELLVGWVSGDRISTTEA